MSGDHRHGASSVEAQLTDILCRVVALYDEQFAEKANGETLNVLCAYEEILHLFGREVPE